MDEQDNLPAVRDERGRFVKGVCPNPEGRKKGTRNWIVEQKLAFEAALRDYVASPDRAQRFLDAIDNLMRIAAGEGNAEDRDAVGAMKILTDKFMSGAGPEVEPSQHAPGAVAAIKVVIENHSASAPQLKAEVVDAEYERQAAPSDGSSGPREGDAGDSA